MSEKLGEQGNLTLTKFVGKNGQQMLQLTGPDGFVQIDFDARAWLMAMLAKAFGKIWAVEGKQPGAERIGEFSDISVSRYISPFGHFLMVQAARGKDYLQLTRSEGEWLAGMLFAAFNPPAWQTFARKPDEP